MMNDFFQIVHSANNRFRFAWEDLSFVGFEDSTCPNCNRTIRTMIYQKEKYKYLLEGGKTFPDWLQFTGGGERVMILSERAIDILQKEKITGFLVKCEADLYIKGKKKQIERATDCPKYYIVDIYGRIDYDYPSMFLKKKRHCTVCNQFSLNRERLYPVYLNKDLWNGNDLCSLITFPGLTYCTERFTQVVKKHKLSGFEFHETRKIEKKTD